MTTDDQRQRLDEWRDAFKTYLKGHYYISGPAILALRQAFSIDNAAADE